MFTNAARLENAADFPQRGIDVGDVFKRLRRGCGVTGQIFQSGIVGGSLKERDIREFTACCFGLLQLVGAWVKPIGDPVFANSLGKVPKKLSTATPDIDNAVTGLESQIFQNRLPAGYAGDTCRHQPLKAAGFIIELHDPTLPSNSTSVNPNMCCPRWCSAFCCRGTSFRLLEVANTNLH